MKVISILRKILAADCLIVVAFGLLYRFLWPVTPPWLDDIVWPLMVFALLVLFFLGK